MQRGKLLAGLLVFGVSAFGADPKLLNLVMPNAKVVSGVNVTNAKNSPFGQFLIAQMQSKGQGLQTVITVTGFDPFTDVNEILAASAADSTQPGGMLAMSGTFDPAKIATAVAGNKNITVETYDGATLVTFAAPGAKVIPGLAFMGTTIAVAGDIATVKAALDQSSKQNAVNPALATQVAALSGTEDAWLVSSASVASLLPGGAATGLPPEASQILGNILAFAGGVKFGTNAQLTAELSANSPQNAEALANVVKLLVSVAAMNTGKTDASNSQLAALLPLLKTLQVTTTGNNLDLALSIPEAQLEALVGARGGN